MNKPQKILTVVFLALFVATLIWFPWIYYGGYDMYNRHQDFYFAGLFGGHLGCQPSHIDAWQGQEKIRVCTRGDFKEW
jgi:hypothetical protein